MTVMVKGKILDIVKAPEDWEIIQQTGGFADIEIEVKIRDNPDDDTDFEIQFSDEKIYARIVNEESGEFVTSLEKLKKSGDSYFCTLRKVPCGGPYLLNFVLSDKRNNVSSTLIGRKRRHFCVGDVYIIAGQSNAAGMGKGFLTEAAEMGIHVLRNLEFWDIATQPFNDLDYSRYGMFQAFARRMKRATGRPVGLIPAAMGGAPLSRWLKEEDGDLYKKLVAAMKAHKTGARAVLWYQGCADVWSCEDETTYLERFKKFVRAIREDLEDEALPIFTFQLNRQKIKEYEAENDIKYGFMRESQRRAAKEIKNLYVLPTVDATIMSDFIHCARASAIMLGERLAMQALDKLYGIGGGADAPEISKAYFTAEREIRLEFENVKDFLYGFNSTLADFPIKAEDESGTLEITDYDVSENTVTLILKRSPYGAVYVSGQSGNDPKNIIIDYGTQLPMLCFYRFKVERGAISGN